jgi:hypothetical protein
MCVGRRYLAVLGDSHQGTATHIRAGLGYSLQACTAPRITAAYLQPLHDACQQPAVCLQPPTLDTRTGVPLSGDTFCFWWNVVPAPWMCTHVLYGTVCMQARGSYFRICISCGFRLTV